MPWVAAVGAPALLTLVLAGAQSPQQRDYVFLYLAVVAVLGVFGGIGPAFLAAGVAFLFVDYYFVPPVGAFTISSQQDIVNLVAFLATAAVVGLLASRRRDALLRAEALTAQLREANSELVRLNREQAEATQSALRLARSEQRVRALQESDRLRRELLANVSHELRTPLATILAESTGLRDADNPAETGLRLDTIAAETLRLKDLVDDMLDMARIEGGALDLNFEALEVMDAIRAATERLQRRSPGRAIRVGPRQQPLAVLADWDRLGQVLDNLLSNADRFAPADTALRVEIVEAGEGLVGVRVADEGPGIEAPLRSRIFERFVHGEGSVTGAATAGTGLGLAIVKGIVEAHAGSVVLEESQAGASFLFTLPLAELA